MIQLILILLGIAYPNNSVNTNNSTSNVLQTNISQKEGNGHGNGGSTTGNTGQTPPPFSQP